MCVFGYISFIVVISYGIYYGINKIWEDLNNQYIAQKLNEGLFGAPEKSPFIPVLIIAIIIIAIGSIIVFIAKKKKSKKKDNPYTPFYKS
jgi:choline-glycine betaine transporter